MDSTIWWYIALAILIAGLIVAGIGIGVFISGMKAPMKEIKDSADSLKERMDKLKLETTSLQHHTTELKEEMQVNSEKIGIFVEAVKGTKNSITDMNSSVRATTDNILSTVELDSRNTAQVSQWRKTVFGLLDIPKNLKTIESNHSNYHLTTGTDSKNK